MKSIAVTEPGRLQVVEVPEPMPTPYQVRLQTEAACLCNITDRKIIEGRFPGVENFPFLLGHETVGIVETVGDKVRNFEMGDRIKTIKNIIGGELINIEDNNKKINVNELFNVNKLKYNQYIDTYIKFPGSPNKELVDILIDFLDKNFNENKNINRI